MTNPKEGWWKFEQCGAYSDWQWVSCGTGTVTSANIVTHLGGFWEIFKVERYTPWSDYAHEITLIARPGRPEAGMMRRFTALW